MMRTRAVALGGVRRSGVIASPSHLHRQSLGRYESCNTTTGTSHLFHERLRANKTTHEKRTGVVPFLYLSKFAGRHGVWIVGLDDDSVKNLWLYGLQSFAGKTTHIEFAEFVVRKYPTRIGTLPRLWLRRAVSLWINKRKRSASIEARLGRSS